MPVILVILFFSAIFASHPLRAQEGLDCVLEPRVTVELGSSEEGILEEVLVSRGDRVEKGQVVAKIDARVERLSAELARLRATSDVEIRSSQVQLEFRQREFERLKTLYEKKTITDRDFNQGDVERKLAQTALESAELEQRVARVDYQRSQARIERRAIRSPVDGVVVKVDTQAGEYVHETVNVVTIAELNPLNVEVFVPVQRFPELSLGMSAKVEPEQPIGGSYQATVTIVDRVFDPASRTFGVRLELENRDLALPAGVRCRVWFSDSESESQSTSESGSD